MWRITITQKRKDEYDGKEYSTTNEVIFTGESKRDVLGVVDVLGELSGYNVSYRIEKVVE